MITRLRKIVQVGVFRKPTELGKYQLKKFTVFYALNTYGKTTLKDIFLSMRIPVETNINSSLKTNSNSGNIRTHILIYPNSNVSQ